MRYEREDSLCSSHNEQAAYKLITTVWQQQQQRQDKHSSARWNCVENLDKISWKPWKHFNYDTIAFYASFRTSAWVFGNVAPRIINQISAFALKKLYLMSEILIYIKVEVRREKSERTLTLLKIHLTLGLCSSLPLCFLFSISSSFCFFCSIDWEIYLNLKLK